jgi:hypothetical protein
MNWTRRTVTVAAAVAALVLLALVPVAHSDQPDLGGFQMRANADAISFIYDQPSFGIPAPHTFELHKMHAETQIDSGPSAHALGSVLWPGDVVGNAGLALAIQLFVADPTSAGYFKPLIDGLQNGIQQFMDAYNKYSGQNGFPPYPVRAESFYPQGPQDSDYPVGGGVLMTSHADDRVTDASSVLQEGGFPGAISVGAVKSTSSSGLVQGKAVSEATTKISNIDIGGGALHVGSVTSDIKATSDGTAATVERTNSIVGLEIGGQAITVDETGMHAGNETQDPLGEISKQLIDKYLTPNGISLTVGKPTKTITGAQATSAIDELTISLNAKGMQTIVAAMPDQYRSWLQNPLTSPLSPLFGQLSSPIQGYLVSPFQFDQNLKIVFGSTSVSTAGAPAFTFTPPPISAPPLQNVLPPVAAPALPPAAPLPPQSVVQGVQRFPITPVAAVAIPIGLVILALAWMLAAGTGLDKMATAATSSAATETCSLEKT